MCVMLGSIKDEASVPGLVQALSDPDTNVRHAAATSLGQIGSRAAVPRLVEALCGEPWLQYPALHALGEIADPLAAPAIVELLDDELLRGPALDALGRLAGREALPRIARHLLDPDPALRNAAIRAVVEIEQRATASGESLDPEVQATLRHEELVTHLIGMLADEDARNRRTAAVTLGWLRETRATQPLLEMLADAPVREFASHALVSIGFADRAAWLGGLAHADDLVRPGPLRCLAWIAPPDGTALVAPLIHDPSAEVRAEAAAAVGRLGDEDAPMLLFELLGDESELIQESAMESLARMSPPRVLPLLVQALAGGDAERACARRRRSAWCATLRRSRRWWWRARTSARRCAAPRCRRSASSAARRRSRCCARGWATRAASCGSRRCSRSAGCASRSRRRCCLPLVAAEDPRLRFAAVRALGQIRNPAAVPTLLPLLGEARKELRFAAVEALGQIRAPEAVRPLVEALRDPDRNLRRAAAEGLGEIGDPQAAPALLVALEDEHWSVRCAAATALGRLRSPKATHALVARLDDPDATVRRAAVSALGEIADPRRGRSPGRGALGPGAAGGRARGPATARHRGPARDGAACSRRARAPTRAGCSWTWRAASRTRPRGACCWPRSTTPSPAVRAEAAVALGDGGFREALRPLLDRKAERPRARGPPGRGERAPEAAAAVKFRHVDHDAELSEEEFRLLRDFVHERFGLYYDDVAAARACARGSRRASTCSASRPSRTTTATCASRPSGPRSSSAW